MKQCFAALTLLVAPSLFASESLTLDQAISIAIRNNPTVKNAQLEIEKGADRLTAAPRNRLPSLKMQTFGSEGLNRLPLTCKEGTFGTFPETGPIPDKDTHIDLGRSFSLFAVAQVTQPISQL